MRKREKQFAIVFREDNTQDFTQFKTNKPIYDYPTAVQILRHVERTKVGYESMIQPIMVDVEIPETIHEQIVA